MVVSTIEKPWTVSITDTNHKRLLVIKKDGERMNDAIGRVLDFYEQLLEQEPAPSDLTE